jgi:hypothetical protein
LTAVPRPNIVPLPVFYGTERCRAEARRYRSRVIRNAGGTLALLKYGGR